MRVIGTFQAPKGKPSLIASNMSAITDMDEITAHYLDAIYTHLYRTTSPVQATNTLHAQQQLLLV